VSGLDGFWAAIDAQLAQLRTAATVDQALAICPGGSQGQGFFAGGDGDDFMGALLAAGWTITDCEASYFWAMKAPDGGLLSYVEGDLYRGNVLP
jgi:hypothetical protein